MTFRDWWVNAPPPSCSGGVTGKHALRHLPGVATGQSLHCPAVTGLIIPDLAALPLVAHLPTSLPASSRSFSSSSVLCPPDWAVLPRMPCRVVILYSRCGWLPGTEAGEGGRPHPTPPHRTVSYNEISATPSLPGSLGEPHSPSCAGKLLSG